MRRSYSFQDSGATYWASLPKGMTLSDVIDDYVNSAEYGSSAPLRRIATLTVSLAILQLAAGCSGSSLPSFGSSNPQSQAASVPPPPNASVAPAGQPYAPPPSQPAAPATAPPAAQQDYSDLMPYPKQSLADVFRDSAQPQGQTIPRPPGTYTPSGQPYTPQAQAGALPPLQRLRRQIPILRTCWPIPSNRCSKPCRTNKRTPRGAASYRSARWGHFAPGARARLGVPPARPGHRAVIVLSRTCRWDAL